MPTSLSLLHSTAAGGRPPVLTGRRRVRTAPGTRAPAGHRRCGQSKEKRGTFNMRGHTAGAVEENGGVGGKREGHLLPAGAGQRPLQPPQRGAGVGPGVAGRRHGGGGGTEGAARDWLVARAPAQRLSHRFPHCGSPRDAPPAPTSALPAAAPNPPPAATAQAQGQRARSPPSAFPALREGGGAAREGRAGGIREIPGEQGSVRVGRQKWVLMFSHATRGVRIFSNYREKGLLMSSGMTSSERMA